MCGLTPGRPSAGYTEWYGCQDGVRANNGAHSQARRRPRRLGEPPAFWQLSAGHLLHGYHWRRVTAPGHPDRAGGRCPTG